MEKSAFCLLSLLMINTKTALAAVAIGLAIVSPGKNFVEPFWLQGSLTQDFRLQVFMNQCSQALGPLGLFRVLKKLETVLMGYTQGPEGN